MISARWYNTANKDARNVLAFGRMIKTLGGVSMSKSISGIYVIVNKVNGDKYIGSSCDIKKRWSQHVRRLNNKNHHSIHLQRAWDKYGSNVFSFNVLEHCAEDCLISVEQKYIDSERPAYNISPTAGRTAGVIRSEEYRIKQSVAQSGKIMSEETRRKISEGMKGKQNSLGVSHSLTQKVKDAIRNKLLGHVVSKETREKISSKVKGFKHTEEAKARIGNASKGNTYASKKINKND